VVACLPLDSRYTGSDSAEDGGYLRAINIRSTTFFGGKVKPSAPCPKILRQFTKRYGYKRDSS
jgi:hypothetical protein